MRRALLVLPLVVACGTSTPEPTAAAAAPSPAAAAAPAEPVAPPPPGAPASAEWATVRLADGAVAAATTEMPPAFRNGAGEIACPVMGMAIKKAEDAVSYADHAGTRYFFCCDSCEKLFVDAPETYANGAYLKKHDLDPTAPAACEEPAKG